MLTNFKKISVFFFTASILVTSCSYDASPFDPTSTSNPVVTVLPAEIAVLNVRTEVTQNGSSLTTVELSISPIGRGNLEVIAPKEMVFGETDTVKVTITPENYIWSTPTPNLTPTPNTLLGQTAVASHAQIATIQALDIYPLMIGELRGLNFHVLPDSPSEKVVTTDSFIEWLWEISPTKVGEQLLVFSLSTPVIVGQNREIKTTKQITILEISITVLPNGTIVAPPASPTSPPIPTAALIPSETPTATQVPTGERIKEEIINNVGIIIVAIIGFIGVALTGYLQYVATKKTNIKKVAKDKGVKKTKTG